MNEAEKRRKPGDPRGPYLGGAEVVMADGQAWALPKPLVRFGRGDGPKGYRRIVVSDVDGFEEKMAAVDRLQEAQDGTIAEYYAATLAVGEALVLRNYDLTPAELDQILQFSMSEEDDPEGYRIMEEVMGVAAGRGPKRSGGTPASS